jgi:hypothetical protein
MALSGYLPKIVTVLSRPRPRYVLAWLLAAIVAGLALYNGWTAFDQIWEHEARLKRRGGNGGHTSIDFGGQWLMGAMAAHGLGPHIYHREYVRKLLQESYPQEEEVPREEWPENYDHEAERLLGWLVLIQDPKIAQANTSVLAPLASANLLGELCLLGQVVARKEQIEQAAATVEITGPLYPPIHALLIYPLGRLSPPHAYRTVQIIAFVCALATGWGLNRLTRGAIWWPIATTGVIVYPGFPSSLILGQNSIFLLLLVVMGWVLLAEGRPCWGGFIWGFLAFKPVWWIALFLVPLLMRRWRFALGMITTGVVLALATLPVVGWRPWLEWWQIGHEASRIYARDQNWIFLSRDLLTVPRRWLLDFENKPSEMRELIIMLIGVATLLVVFEITARFVLVRRQSPIAAVSPMAAFVILGACLCCYHFMYYDILLTALPVTLLLAELSRYLEPRFLVAQGSGNFISRIEAPDYYLPHWAADYPSSFADNETRFGKVWLLNSLTLNLIFFAVIFEEFAPGFPLSMSVSVGQLDSRVIPMPLKFSTAIGGTPWVLPFLIALWLWSGWLAIRDRSRAAELL